MNRVADAPSGHSVGHKGSCSILFMEKALRAVACATVTALLAAACGTNDEIVSPGPTDAPVATTTAQVTAEPSPAPTPTPEPTLYVHSSGLACYGGLSEDWHDDYADYPVGVPTVDEAAALWWKKNSVGRWWIDRDGRYTISAEDLTQHPSDGKTVAFRDSEGNAQVLAYAFQLPDGNWIIASGESCV